MGVTGLWSTLNEAGHPVNLDSLKDKRLAVDASIWMYHFARVASGSSQSRQAFIISGLCRRLAKLCHFHIKPVFVFDGPPPLLKREELRRRHEARNKADLDMKRIAEAILKTKLKILLCGGKKVKAKVDREDSLFELKPLPHHSIINRSYEESEESEEEEDFLIDIDSDVFRSLPMDIQQDYLLQMKERFDLTQDADILKKNPMDFTRSQLLSVQKRRRITMALDKLRKPMSIQPQRIASNPKRAFVLVKNDSHGYSFLPKCIEKEKDVVEGDSVSDDEKEFMETLFNDESECRSVQEENASIESAVEVDDEIDNVDVIRVEAVVKKDVLFEIDGEIDSKECIIENIRNDIVCEIRGESGVNEQKGENKEIVKDYGNIIDVSEQKCAIEKQVNEWVSDLQELNQGDQQQVLASLNEHLTTLQDKQTKLSLLTDTPASELEYIFKELLECFGYPWMKAPAEAEAQCAYLYMHGHVDGIITDDVDVFLFGGDCVYRYFFKQSKSIIKYELKKSKYSRQDLIFMAILIGGDYGPGLKGVGVKRAEAMLREGMMDNRVPLQRVIMDAYLNPSVDSQTPVKWGKINASNLSRFMHDRAHWTDGQIEQILK